VKLGFWFVQIGASKSELLKATDGSAWAMRADGDAMEVFIRPDSPSPNADFELWRFTTTS
jgi:hypothetical protein